MKMPLQKGALIDARRYRSWTDQFVGYRDTVTKAAISSWLDQFETADKDLAARLLDTVHFITIEQMAAAFRSALQILPGWSLSPGSRQGNWRFVAFSQSAGESGDTMIHKFRLANNLSGRKYNHLFIYPSQIATARLGPNDTIVFIDDFVGTGEQAISAWNDMFQELVADVGRVYLVVVAARQSGRVEVTEKTGLALVNHIELNDSDNVFDASCPAFDQTDKDTILKYCHSCDAKNPKGWGNGGLVVVLAHKCPNNTIPILHVRNEQWMGLFPRYD